METFILVILALPFIGLLAWGLVDPEESFMFGRRWTFKGEVEPSEEALKIHKISCIVGLIIIGLMFLNSILRG